jgi:hypothetical protein
MIKPRKRSQHQWRHTGRDHSAIDHGFGSNDIKAHSYGAERIPGTSAQELQSPLAAVLARIAAAAVLFDFQVLPDGERGARVQGF